MRHDKVAHKSVQLKKRAFLEAFRNCGVISRAAEKSNTPRTSHYQWMADPEYAAAFEQATNDASELMEIEARRRAIEGVRRPVLYKGEVVMVPSDPTDPKSDRVPLFEHEYSDTLLIFLLNGAMPEKYRKNMAIDHTTGGKPMKAFLDIDASRE